MRIKQLLLTGAVALVISSCGQEEGLSPEPSDSSPISMTFSVLAETGKQSRAGTDLADPLPTRAYMYIKDNSNQKVLNHSMPGTASNGQFSFTLELDRSHSYTVAFWADGGRYTIDPDSGLESITYETPNDNTPAIAYAKCVSDFKPTEATATITLQHAVAKLVMRESETLNIGDKVNVSFTRDNYTYSAVKQTYTPDGTTPVSLSLTVNSETQKGDIMECYMLAPNESSPAGNDPAMLVGNFTIEYTPAGETPSHKQSIPNVSFKANHRTIIAGDIMDLSKLQQTFAITVDNTWSDTTSPPINDNSTGDDPDNSTPSTDVATITLNSAGTLTNEMLVAAIGSGNALKINGPINDADFSVMRGYLLSTGDGKDKRLSLDLSGADFTTLPESAFSSSTLSIYGKDTSTPTTGLKEIILPEGLTAISDGAFIDCVNLTDVTIPTTVTKLGDMAFYRSGITRLYAPNVTIVNGNACDGCTALTHVVLGNLTEIWDAAFKACDSLTTFDITRCTAVPQSGNPIFGYSETPNLTIYVASEALMTQFKEYKQSTTAVWTKTKPKWAVGSPSI